MKHGGGADFRLMQETELYVRVHGKPGRTLRVEKSGQQPACQRSQ